MIEVQEKKELTNKNLFLTQLKGRSLLFTSTGIAMAISACGREIRSTTEVPLADQPCTPTAFDDICIGDDDQNTFTTLAGNDEIRGFGGDDQIIAGSGNDIIYGGDGDDNIQPGDGNDKVYGQGGNDTIYLSGGDDIEDGGDGIDTIFYSPDQATVPMTFNLDTGKYHVSSLTTSISQNLFHIENFTGEGGTDLTIYDTSGINVITTGTGNDTIHSKGGDDTITTGAGNDTVYLGNGVYSVDLGAGDDKIYLNTEVSIINGNTGTDEAIVRQFDGFVDVVVDLQFNTYYVPSKLPSLDGMELPLQGFEKVTIDGQVNAEIYGTVAADTIVGDAGADKITGRGGADTLTGGTRSDSFIFASGDTGITEASADTITDFSTGTDKIDITNVGTYVEADGAGTANLNAFITAANASLTTASYGIYAQYNLNGAGNTYVVVDEDKSGAVNAGDTLIILTGLSTADGLDASDFI